MSTTASRGLRPSPVPSPSPSSSLGLAPLGVGPASAHASLVSSDPRDGATLDRLPSRVSFTFSEDVVTPAYVVVRTADGSDVTSGEPVVDGATVSQELDGSAATGEVTLAYRVVSVDGHPVTGELAVTVAEPAHRPSATAPGGPERRRRCGRRRAGRVRRRGRRGPRRRRRSSADAAESRASGAGTPRTSCSAASWSSPPACCSGCHGSDPRRDTDDACRPTATATPTGLTGRRLALLVVLPALAAGGLLLTLAGGVPEETPVGLPEPGRLTTWGLPVLNLLDNLLAVLVVGSLLVPLLTMRRPDEEVRGGRSGRSGRSAAWRWPGRW